MITINNLNRIYQAGNVETIALKNINFSVKEGDFVAVMGPSGCGKTTLLNIIGMIDYADTGSYNLLGKDVFLLSEKENLLFEKARLFARKNIDPDAEQWEVGKKTSIEAMNVFSEHGYCSIGVSKKLGGKG